MTFAHVAIVGTGPGGAMAALHLAESGLRVLLIEKKQLPRAKSCGGCLSPEIRSFFDWNISRFVEAEIHKTKFLYDHKAQKTTERRTESPPFMMVNRRDFDHHLIEKAVSLGNGNIILRDGYHVTFVEEKNNRVTLHDKKGNTVHADFVIAADGAFSKTAKCLGLNSAAPFALAIDAELEVAREVYEKEKDFLTINLFCLPMGYGWIFPKKDYLSCGVIAWSRNKDAILIESLNDFLQKSFPSRSIHSVRRLAHPVPIYGGHRDIASRRVCLVGDAANLVDPTNGGGIHFALQSGRLAADVILSLATGKPVADLEPERPSWDSGGCLSYQRLIHQGMGRELDILYRYALPVFLDAPQFFYRKFILEGASPLSYFSQVAKRFDELRGYNRDMPLV